MKKTSKDMYTGFLWKLVEQYGSQFITLLVTMVLARLLSPNDYGVIALTTLFTALADILVQASLGTALIQKSDLKKEDCSTALWLSGGMAVLVYTLLFVGAPCAAAYFEKPMLAPILRVLSIVIAIQGVNSVLSAELIRNMRFQTLTKAHLIGSVFGGILGITLAFLGFGPWAIVFQRIGTQAVLCVILLLKKKSRWGVAFSRDSAKRIIGFSGRLMIGSLVAFASDNIYTAVIGKAYSSEDLAYMDKADALPRASILGLAMSVASVSLPAFSSYQEDKIEMREVIRKTLRTTAYVAFPMTAGIAATAVPLVRVLFSDTWLPSAFMMQMLCVWYLTLPFLHINGQAMAAAGRTDLSMRMEIFKACITVPSVLLVATVFSAPVIWLVLLKGAISMVIIAIASIYSKRIYRYSLKLILADQAVPLLLSAVMFAVVYPLSLLPIHPVLQLVIQVPVGMAVYVALSWLFKVEAFQQIRGLLLNMLRRRKKNEENPD